MKFPYYPGCTLKDSAEEFNESAHNIADALGFELDELEEWQCCGAVYPLSTDGLFPLAAPLRNLVRAEEMGDKMVTLCSACYNVHKRADHTVKNDEEKLERLNSYNREDEYNKGVEVVHLIEVLRDEIGFDRLEEAAERDLGELKVASYYGCLLLRPEEELQFDDPEDPSLFEDLISSLGCEAVKFPDRCECCGAYATVHLERPPESAVRAVVSSAVSRGADLIAVSCPLCQYNLEESQNNILEKEPGFADIPIVYFTELMEYAFGLTDELAGLDLQVK